MDASLYLTIGWYLGWTIIAVSSLILLSRLFRTMPYYVKNGNMGDDGNDLMFDSGKTNTSRLYNLFNETHPNAILMDAFTLFLIALVSGLLWGLVPIFALGWLVVQGIVKYAQYLRERHLKKQKFVENLKG